MCALVTGVQTCALPILRAKVETLEARIDQASPPPVSAPTPAPAPSTTEVKWKGAPEIRTESGWSFKPRGRILIDAGYVDAPSRISNPALGFTNELRRARLGVEGTIPGEIGRASCRERVCQYVEICVCAGSSKKKIQCT